MLYRKNGGPPRALPAIDYDAAGQPWSNLANNAAGRLATGWAPAPEPPPYDPVRELLRWDEQAEAWAVEPSPIGPRQAQLVAAIDAERDRRQREDLAFDFGETVALDDLGDPQPAGERLLQMGERNQRDWIALHSAAVAAVVAGQGETVMPIRAEDNWNIQTTALQLLEVGQAMLARNSAILFHGGALKTAVRAAVSHAELDAIDLAEGWPE